MQRLQGLGIVARLDRPYLPLLSDQPRLEGLGVDSRQIYVETINSRERVETALALLRIVFFGMAGLTQTLIPPSQRQPIEALNDALDLSYGDKVGKHTGFLIMLTLSGMIAIAGDTLDLAYLLPWIRVLGLDDAWRRVTPA